MADGQHAKLPQAKSPHHAETPHNEFRRLNSEYARAAETLHEGLPVKRFRKDVSEL
jgi:hypothetical protein